ncbi:MAG TPA: prolyl oligopeptidase family serine peptidase [Fimbriimonadaceae bacterium]|nr:prolyl oligopeptidase family serine peptidase [Fimbriimonadaceae bacterium]HRJ97522.1 prolyl oligopeptidase family serine peptidase [Fimbriimonadaceae bacterium]
MILFAALFVLGASAPSTIEPYVPTPSELRENYRRADRLGGEANKLVDRLSLTPNWVDDQTFWYLTRDRKAGKRFVLVRCVPPGKGPAFDHERMAKALGETLKRDVRAGELPFDSIEMAADRKSISFRIDDKRYRVDLDKYAAVEEAPPAAEPRTRREMTTRIHEGQVQVRKSGEWTTITKEGNYSSFSPAPDDKRGVAFRLIPGERRKTFLLRSTNESARAALSERLYDLPGDVLDTFETWVIDLEASTERKIDLDPIMGGGQPWSRPPNLQWTSKGQAIMHFPIRGYQRVKVVGIDAAAATATTLVDERAETFVDLGRLMLHVLGDGSLIWRSERSGWGHLYLVESGQARAITSGDWVVRSIENVDEAGGTMDITANGREPGQDPYHIHHYRVGLKDGKTVRITEGDGTHRVSYSPNRNYAVDTWSRVDSPPKHVLRRTRDGAKLLDLEQSSDEELRKAGFHVTERFTAKGRDGKTDIWGVVVRPTYWQADKKYPVIENIYAGPHDSHVPKEFRAYTGMNSLAELGFIVVQIDGMGTNNRGKAFHDVCWKNLADAGFPDRKLWLRALAAKDPTVDLSRVGVYGTSAGGQNAAGAVLFHADFYHVAVASCGCHDNRMDKQWWNEQWMGYPVGPHYAEQSNITHASKLKGKLLLMVGELDRNVPPESTTRFADALIKANKEFEFVLLPGQDHTGGGTYGERKRRDFFVKHLLGVAPPDWNGG